MRGGPHTSYLLEWVQEVARHDVTPARVGFSALVAVLVEVSGAFNRAFWIVALLWSADMVLGNLRAWTDPKVEWRLDKNLDGVLRAAVYLILAVVFQLIEQLLQIRGIDVGGLFVFGLYSILSLAEIRSIIGHGTHFTGGGLGKLYRRFGALAGDPPEDRDAP